MKNPIDFFNQWFNEPIVVANISVEGIIEALNLHPLANDETSQNYVMPIWRCREAAGKYRIFGENQDVYYCFVYDGNRIDPDPPVYFESSLCLEEDYGFDAVSIIDNDHVLIANRFTDFLWHILGQHICLRLDFADCFKPEVNGIFFGSSNSFQLDNTFFNPLGNEFPAGYSCFFSERSICIPHWGAAFLDSLSRDSFIERFQVQVEQFWDTNGSSPS